MAIEIGTIVSQDTYFTQNYSIINYNVPATGSGTITAVTFEVKTETAELTIIIFEEVGAHTFTARSYQILGVKAAGVHSDVAVSLVAVTGDYIGYYYLTGEMYQATSGGAGLYALIGNKRECVSTEFTLSDADGKSYLYGTGAEAAVGGGGMVAVEAILAGEL